jgi:hypothetical protein
MERERAVDRLAAVVDAVETERLPVPVREVWTYGDVALGVDPVDRLEIYLTKEVLMGGDPPAERPPDLAGVEGIGSVVRTEWARDNPDLVRTDDAGYAAPDKCLAAHLLPDDEPVHLEVCNAPFRDNVTRRLEGARARGDYSQAIDPRGVALWIDGQRSTDAFRKLRASEFAFPPLSTAFESLGLAASEATAAARAVHAWREDDDGVTVRGDVV